MSITEKLYEPFGQLPSRRGRGGVYTFIPSNKIFDRLNEVFGVNWSSESTTHEIVGENVIVKVRVTVKDPETKEYFFQEGFGGAPLNQNEAGDPYKSAYSKALKDACKHWGLGLHKSEESGQVAPQTPATPPAAPTPAAPVAPQTPATPQAPVVEQPVAAPQAAPAAPPLTPQVPDMGLPPNVPEVVEQAIPVQQVAPPVEQPVAAPVAPQAPAVPQMPSTPQVAPATPAAPAAAVAPPTPSAPQVAPEQPAQSRPSDVPLSPIERVKRAKQQAPEEPAIPAVPPPSSAVESPAPTDASEGMITSVQKVAIEGLIEMKGLNYDEIATKALGLASGSAPAVETLTHNQAISVIQYINNKFK